MIPLVMMASLSAVKCSLPFLYSVLSQTRDWHPLMRLVSFFSFSSMMGSCLPSSMMYSYLSIQSSKMENSSIIVCSVCCIVGVMVVLS